MCQDCGCGDPTIVSVEVHERLLAGNDRIAHHNREHFRSHGVTVINVMGSPGAGKTALLEATARALGDRRRLAAITGDLETERDAVRLRAAGVPTAAITTGSACHLDAEMVHHVLHDESRHHALVHDVDYLFVENVGNLVCPAIYDLGQHVNVVALSVTEGEDKPLKYPVMFRNADLVLVTKTDLLAALPDFDRPALDAAITRSMRAPRSIAVSARRGDGLGQWIAWIESVRSQALVAPRPIAMEVLHG
ncbi:MAG: hydrogenase nickel incorporation protein HypB [bacterium]